MSSLKLVKELRASVTLDAINGNVQEKLVCEDQMIKAASCIEALQVERDGEDYLLGKIILKATGAGMTEGGHIVPFIVKALEAYVSLPEVPKVVTVGCERCKHGTLHTESPCSDCDGDGKFATREENGSYTLEMVKRIPTKDEVFWRGNPACPMDFQWCTKRVEGVYVDGWFAGSKEPHSKAIPLSECCVDSYSAKLIGERHVE